MNYWPAEWAPVPLMDRWRRLGVAYLEVIARLLEQPERCSGEMHSRTFLSH